MNRRARLQDAVGEERPLETKRVPHALGGDLIGDLTGPVRVIEPLVVEDGALETDSRGRTVDRRVPVLTTLCSHEYSAAGGTRPQEHLPHVAALIAGHVEYLSRPPLDGTLREHQRLVQRAGRLLSIEHVADG